MICDLRSDTVTKPTTAMLAAMMQAEVGDDVFGEDPTVNKLEKKCAEMLGMDSALFCPSGTMTNQIAIKILTQPFDEVICYKNAHIYKYEGGGLAGNSNVSVRLLMGDRGRISVDEIAANINNVHDVHFPVTTVVALENTVMREAGSFYTVNEISKVSSFARSKKLKMHLDGARLFNAIVKTKDPISEYGNHFDTISICLSKGLGAPVGSILAYKKEYEAKARRMRKAFGGGMRQAGFLAAAGLYALENHVDRLQDDHKRAKKLGEVLQKTPWVKSVMPVDTNIVIVEVNETISAEKVLSKLTEHQIKASLFSPTSIRFVTHLDFSDDLLNLCSDVFLNIKF